MTIEDAGRALDILMSFHKRAGNEPPPELVEALWSLAGAVYAPPERRDRLLAEIAELIK